MKTALVLALLASLAIPSVAAAGRPIDTGCDTVVKRAVPGPKGDPLYRIVVRNKSNCWFEILEGDGATMTVAGKQAVEGQRVKLPPGDYVGTWDDIHAPSAFTIEVPPPVKVRWRFKSKGVVEKKDRMLAAGCVWRSRWRDLDPGTRSWIVVDGVRIKQWTSAPLGFYGQPRRGFVRGVTCG